MENKPYTKSLTMRSLILLIVITLMNILGIGEAEPGKTYDTMLEMEGRKTEQVKNLLLLGAAGSAAVGRARASTKLGKKKGAGDE